MPYAHALQIRRYTRLRREYLYRKSLEGKDRERYEKKRILKKALAGTVPLTVSVRLMAFGSLLFSL